MTQKELERHLRWVILDQFADKSVSEKELVLNDTQENWDEIKNDPEIHKLLNLAKEFYNKGVTDSAESAESYILKYPLHNPKSAVDKQSILKNIIP